MSEEQASIPEYLGKCEILKIHDDGDLTILCGDEKYVVTKEGEVFRKVEPLPIEEGPSEEWLKKTPAERRKVFLDAMRECVRLR